MLDGNQRRGRAGFLTVAGTMAVAALLLVAIGPLTAVAQQSRQPSGESTSRRVTALDRALYEAAEAGDLRDIEELLKAGANVNAVIQGDGTPLLGAARKGQLPVVSLLLGRGADPNIPARGDGTLLSSPPPPGTPK
jgi:ankyrin repeat protein